MTVQELKAKIDVIQVEMNNLAEEVPASFEEFNTLRLRQDTLLMKFTMYQNIMNSMMMQISLDQLAARQETTVTIS